MSASLVSVWPASQTPPPATASTIASRKGPSADFISSSRKFSEVGNRQLQRQRDRPQARRPEGVAGELRLLTAVALDVDATRRAHVDVLDRVEHRLLVAGRVELAAGRFD